MTVTETLKHSVEFGEREAEYVLADMREMVKTAEAAVARGCKTLGFDWSASGTCAQLSGTHDTTPATSASAAEAAPEQPAEASAPTDPPA